MDDSRVPLQFTEEDEWSPEQYKNQGAKVSSGEAWDLSFQRSRDYDTGVGLFGRMQARSELEAITDKKITPEEANEQYPDMPNPFTEAVSPYVAQMMYDRHAERMEFEEKMAGAPQDAWSKTKYFGAGMLAHMSDPLEVAAGMALGAVLGTAWVGTRLGIAGVRTTAAGRVGQVAVEQGISGVIENTAQEVAFAREERIDLQNYDVSDGLINVAAGTVASAGMGVAMREGARAIGNQARKIPFDNVLPKKDALALDEPGFFDGDPGVSTMLTGVDTSIPIDAPGRILDDSFNGLRFEVNRLQRVFADMPDAELGIQRVTMSHLLEHGEVNLKPFINTLARETDVTPVGVGGLFEYNYVPLKTGTTTGGKFFAVIRSDSFDADQAVRIGDQVGVGMQITDNPGVAQAVGNRPYGDAGARVHEIDIEALNPLDLNKPVPPDVVDAVANALRPFIKDSDEVAGMENLKDIFNELWDQVDSGMLDRQVILDFQDSLKRGGYDSLLDNGRSVLGVTDHSPHNQITMLDSTKLKSEKNFLPDKRIIRNPPEEEIEAAKNAWKDTESARASDLVKNQADELDLDIPAKNSEVDLSFKELADDINTKEALGLVDAETAMEFRQAMMFHENMPADKMDLIFKRAKDCVLGGG